MTTEDLKAGIFAEESPEVVASDVQETADSEDTTVIEAPAEEIEESTESEDAEVEAKEAVFASAEAEVEVELDDNNSTSEQLNTEISDESEKTATTEASLA